MIKYQVSAFFILAFIISWGAILLFFGSAAIPASAGLREQIGTAVLLGPVVSGLMLILLSEGWPGLRRLGARLIKWRVKPRWYAAALLAAPLSTGITLAVFRLYTGERRPAILHAEDPFGLAALALIGGLTVALFEELGWTGLAVPRLLRKFNIFRTGALVGLVWGAWHFILFWEPDSFTEIMPFLVLMARLFAWLPAYRILMVWVYKNTQSLLLTVLMHAALVASIVILDPVIEGHELFIYILLRACVFWAFAVLISGIQFRLQHA